MPITRVHMDGLCCDKTTEPGADEIYILVIGQGPNGTRYAARVPGPAMHWDMNDGKQGTNNPSGDSHCIADKDLFTRSMQEGDQWDLLFLIMEEDGGSTKTAQDIATGILAQTGNPYAIGGAAVLQVLTQLGIYLDNTDDYIGSFGVQLSCAAGLVTAAWRGVDRYTIAQPNTDPAGHPGFEFRMNGDGSNYVGWYHLRTVA